MPDNPHFLEILVGGSTGYIHLVAAIVAMITGMIVIISAKGTKRHKQVGYVYVAAMIVLNVTSFMIYRLFDRFGVFHWLAVISSVSLLAGMFPVIFRRDKKYLVMHLAFMYWSVVGLYSAFMAETFTRLPKLILTETGEPMVIFYKLVGLATGLTIAAGAFYFIRYRKRWMKEAVYSRMT